MSKDFQIMMEELNSREDYLSRNFLKIVLSNVIDMFYLLRYKLRFRRPAPGLYDIIWVDPKEVEFSIPSYKLPEKTQPLGIADGKWDLTKRRINETSWIGLIERFGEGKEWEETEYYKNGVERIRKGENLPVKRAENAETLEDFEEYLENVDELYHNIKSEGYREDSRIELLIGRNGEFIINSGYHRLILSQILDIDEIPAKVKYRHSKWQEKREKLYDQENLCGSKHNNLIRKHPDIKNKREISRY